MESFFRLHFDVPWRRVLATESTGRRDTISGFAGGQDIRRRCGSLRLLPSPGRSMSGQRKHGSLETRHNFEPPTVMADDMPYRKTVSLHSLYNHQPASSPAGENAADKTQDTKNNHKKATRIQDGSYARAPGF